MTGSQDDSGMVRLPGGYQVPPQFPARLMGHARKTPFIAEVAIEMAEGRPCVRAIAIGVPDPASGPLTEADLRAISLARLAEDAVQQAAAQHTPMQWQPPSGDGTPVPLNEFVHSALQQLAAHERGALTAARASRDRRRITPGDLRRVLDIYTAKGVDGIMRELGYSERNARRLLARARKELQQ